MKIDEVMTREVTTCKPNDSLADCATMMRELNVGAMPIVDDNNKELVGIITDRDIAVRAVAKGEDPNEAQAGRFMTPRPITVEPDTNVEDAAELMASNQVRRLPVVQHGKLVGIVSLGDLAVDLGEEELVAETLEAISVPVR